MTQLIHNPFGQQHPYEQLPEERFPRKPLAGETFTVGIVTRPVGAVQSVRVCSTLNGIEQAPIAAQRQDTWRPELEHGVGAEYLERIVRIEQDVWQAQLIAPAQGHILQYWLEADDLKTETFTIIGEAWETAGGASFEQGKVQISPKLSEINLPRLKRIEWLSDKSRVRLYFHADADEAFYGLGERFNALNQRGNIMDIRVYEQYKNHGKKTYMPIPFLLSSAGYGVWVESSRYMQFDLAASQPDEWILEADLGAESCLTLRWFEDNDPFAIVGQFATMTGPTVLPPQWAFGLWMSGNEWNSQARIEKEVNASLEHGIQPSVMVIEAWSDENTFYIWNDAQYTPISGDKDLNYADFTFPKDGKWTDPKGMIDWLHANDIKVLLWQIPVMKKTDAPHPQQDNDRTYFEQAGFGVHEADSSLHQIRPFWFRGGYIWDVTNPAERDWWFKKRAYLLEMGVDGFKTDGGEHLWGEDVIFAAGQGAEIWNEYPRHYSEAYYQFAQQNNGIVFSRAGFTGSQRAPLHWAGDENSTWDAFRHSILAGLSAGISGISFWGWDIAGFSGEIPTAELYLRATAMAAFCPVFQYHSEYNAHREPSNDRTPWNMQARTGDERIIPLFRHFLEARQKLMPYIWQEAQYSAATGQPMMRAAQVLYPQSSQYDYFFGRNMLVSPVIEAGAETWAVYLPEGQWKSLWTSEIFVGGRSYEIAAPLDTIPVFTRVGDS
jgi:alpha-glucosidase (family GH31 glycosyl hydrolase)